MFLSILKWSLISLTIIYLIHHLYIFFLNTLTVPKIKDLVNKPNEQYDEMFKMLQGNRSGCIRTEKNTNKNNNNNNNNNNDNDKMTEELSSFLNDLKKNPESETMKNGINSQMNTNNDSNNNIFGSNEFDSYSTF
jgi:hypothetical protein